MLVRSCAGGIVFSGEKVLLLQNEKQEWVMPKGVIRDAVDPRAVARGRVLAEAGVEADIIAGAGDTCYEFYSVTRGRPVCNKIQWYLMEAKAESCCPAAPFTRAEFLPVEEALERITYTQDRSLLAVSWEKYRKMDKIL